MPQAQAALALRFAHAGKKQSAQSAKPARKAFIKAKGGRAPEREGATGTGGKGQSPPPPPPAAAFDFDSKLAIAIAFLMSEITCWRFFCSLALSRELLPSVRIGYRESPSAGLKALRLEPAILLPARGGYMCCHFTHRAN